MCPSGYLCIPCSNYNHYQQPYYSVTLHSSFRYTPFNLTSNHHSVTLHSTSRSSLHSFLYVIHYIHSFNYICTSFIAFISLGGLHWHSSLTSLFRLSSIYIPPLSVHVSYVLCLI